MFITEGNDLLADLINKTLICKVLTISPDDLIISSKVRQYCIENKCGEYGINLMCPPYIGSVKDFKNSIKEFKKGYLVIFKKKIKNPSDRNQYHRSAERLHKALLIIEKESRSFGFTKSSVYIGGSCKLCEVCNAAHGKLECRYPKQARPSLEAMGIDVINTCGNQGAHIVFKKNEVTWVGLLLV